MAPFPTTIRISTAHGPNNDYIWSRGWRNPYTITFQETTGQLWVNAVGTTYEQIFKVNAGDHGGWNDWEGNQPGGYIQPEIVYRTGTTDSRTILTNGAVRSGNVVTFTTTIPPAPSGSSAAAFLQPGNKITIADVTDSSFNGTFDILSVISSTQFTVAQTGADATSSGGTRHDTQLWTRRAGRYVQYEHRLYLHISR